MDNYLRHLSGAWDFATAHPFVSAWLALATAWAIYTFGLRDRA